MELAAAKVAVSTGCAEIVLGKSSMLRTSVVAVVAGALTVASGKLYDLVMSIAATVKKVFAGDKNFSEKYSEGASWTSLASTYFTGIDLGAAGAAFSDSDYMPMATDLTAQIGVAAISSYVSFWWWTGHHGVSLLQKSALTCAFMVIPLYAQWGSFGGLPVINLGPTPSPSDAKPKPPPHAEDNLKTKKKDVDADVQPAEPSVFSSLYWFGGGPNIL